MIIALTGTDIAKWYFDRPLPFFHTAGHIHYGLEFLRLLLNLCTCTALLFLLVFWFSNSLKLKTIALVIMIIGAGNLLGREILGTDQFGALYERDEYEIEYEAELYQDFYGDSKPIFCIVSIEHSKGLDLIPEEKLLYFYDCYYLVNINLPYERSYEGEYLDFYPGERNHLSLGSLGTFCYIKLGDVATEKSYQRLSNEVLSANGEVVASKNGDVYHNENWCPHVKKIKKENLIRFNSTWEAELIGFKVCQDCDYW